MEDIFCEITNHLLDYNAEAVCNEGCGPLGNDRTSLYRARDLSKKHGLTKLTEILNLEVGDSLTSKEYNRERSAKLKKLNKLNQEKERKELEKRLSDMDKV